MKRLSGLLWSCLATTCLSVGVHSGAEARVTRITSVSTVIDLPAFGATGPYMKITGTFEGELDPADPRNAVIADMDRAPRSEGKVRYTSTFFILRPVDQSKGNGKIFFDFGNRGNKRVLQWLNDGTATDDPSTAQHFGNGFLMRQGYSVAMSGWVGDVRPTRNRMSISLPIAVNPDGSTITGPVVAELVAEKATDNTINLPYSPADRSSANGILTVRERQSDPKIELAGWSYVDDRKVSFPGPAKPHWIYEFVYTGKEPQVMGIGHAATRDFISFLRHASVDDFGNPNPLATPGGVRSVVSWGRSNGGRGQRDFLRWGFNQDEEGRRVIDGMMPFATGSGGHMWLNARFSQPSVSARKHERHFSPEPEFPHTFAVTTDPLTGQRAGILERCLETKTCPKVFTVEGANEYWNKSSSLNHTDARGQDLDVDALAPNVRIYSLASIEHNTTFDERPAFQDDCQQMTNPIYNGPVFRALSVALDQWVSSDVKPPASSVPRRSDGTLVAPEKVKYPAIPATHYAGWPQLPAMEYSPDTMNRNAPFDFTVVPPKKLPGLEYTVQVSQVDEDGNDLGGVRLPELHAPLGTYTGWSVLPRGAGYPDTCGQHGQFIPFANTKEERLAAGDPRLSLAERYPDQSAFVSRITEAAQQLVQQRFLLPEDAAAYSKKASETPILKSSQ